MKVILKKQAAESWREGTYYPGEGFFIEKRTGKRVYEKNVFCYVESVHIVYLKTRHSNKVRKTYGECLQEITQFTPLLITPDELLQSTNEFAITAKRKNRKREIKLVRWYFIVSMVHRGHTVQKIGDSFKQNHSTITHVCKSVLQILEGPDVVARIEFNNICEEVRNSFKN